MEKMLTTIGILLGIGLIGYMYADFLTELKGEKETIKEGAIYDIVINQSTGNVVSATLTQWGVSKTIQLETGNQYLDVTYNFFGDTGYIKSGWTPDLLDLIWSGKSHLQRIWGAYGSY